MKETVTRDKTVAHFHDDMPEVYGTPLAHSSKALDDGFGGKVETLEDAWKTWVRPFTVVATNPPPPSKIQR